MFRDLWEYIQVITWCLVPELHIISQIGRPSTEMARIISRAKTNVLLSTKPLKKHSILEKRLLAIILGNYYFIVWLASCRRLYTQPWHELIDLGTVPLLMFILPWALRKYASQFAVTVSFYFKKKWYLITDALQAKMKPLHFSVLGFVQLLPGASQSSNTKSTLKYLLWLHFILWRTNNCPAPFLLHQTKGSITNQTKNCL